MTRAFPSAPGRQRWPGDRPLLVVAAVSLLAAAVLVACWSRHGAAQARPRWQPPPQMFLTSSMRVQPAPGWTTPLSALGVPGGGILMTNSDPFASRPFVGNLGERAYFVAGSPGTSVTQWWLLGIDVRDGHPLFSPVRLSSETDAPKCFLNGPDQVLCVRNDIRDVTAWVTDAHTGVVTFAGPTDLRVAPATLTVHQVGIYALAETDEQGVYGIGPHAETTWFVPGNGMTPEMYVDPEDVARPAIAIQGTPGRGSYGEVVFSLSDGAVIRPEIGAEFEQQTTVVYPGGFAALIAARDRSREAVDFFDVHGRRLGRDSVEGDLTGSKSGNPVLPIVELSGGNHWAVFTPDGGKLLEVTGGPAPSYTRLIGSRFFVLESTREGINTAHWQEYDLQTGTKGKACDPDMLGYLGSDGTVAVLADGNPNFGLVTKAMDLQTCDTLWTIRSAVGSFRNVWRVNTTLVQLSDDGKELMSLVAPH